MAATFVNFSDRGPPGYRSDRSPPLAKGSGEPESGLGLAGHGRRITDFLRFDGSWPDVKKRGCPGGSRRSVSLKDMGVASRFLISRRTFSMCYIGAMKTDSSPFELWALASGEIMQLSRRLHQPKADEMRGMLLEIREELNLGAAQLGAILGVPRSTVRKWLEGTRCPSGCAPRLIWLLHGLVFEQGVPMNMLSWLFWKRATPAPNGGNQRGAGIHEGMEIGPAPKAE